MTRMFRKFLVAGTALCLSGAPALSQAVNSTATSAIDARADASAHIGEIKPRDVETYRKQMLAALAMTDTRRRDAAITSARQELAQNTRKPLSAGSPQLGATG